MKRVFLLSVFLQGSFSVLAIAQADISPGVVRISLIQGDVSVQRGDTGEWSAAALNQPVVGGDRVSTGDRSQAELQLDHANIIRLGNNTQIKVATIGRTQIQVQVAQGVAYYTVLRDSEAEVEIDTPNAAIRPTSQEGVYRIEVNGFETHVISRTGAADISTPQGSIRVEKGQAATIRGTAQDSGNVLGGASVEDSWDSWNSDRDGVIRNAQSWNHTNRYFVGSEDLDAHGHWVNLPDYGQVWSPNVGGNWVPYRDGRWVWEPYWGWTWVSHEPWGWAPYHYGRWFLYGTSWMWWPGPVNYGSYRPEWAPAYVSFFGFGHRGNTAGSRFGSVGWLPIGPGDHFYPWYGRHGAHFNVVNVTAATNITNIDRGFDGIPPLHRDNRFSNVRMAATDVRVSRAVSTLRADLFGTGRSAAATVSREAFRNGRMMIGNLPIVAGREALSATNRPVSSSSIMRGGPQERFFTKRQPAPATQSVDKQVAQVPQVPEDIPENGLLIPAGEVTPLDSPETVRPAPSENTVERTVLSARAAPGGRTSRSRAGNDLRTTLSPRTQRPKSASTRRTTALAPGSRRTPARTASRPGSGSRATPPSRTAKLISTPTRRATTLASGSRGPASRTAQSYVSSAAREMDKGNYMAAIASYRQALHVDGNSDAAKARLDRARRAMLAENKIIADRR